MSLSSIYDNCFSSVDACFSKYAEFEGRSSRAEYWYFMLFLAICSIITKYIGFNAIVIELLLFIIPNFAVQVRRLHDTNHSGWHTVGPVGALLGLAYPGGPGTQFVAGFMGTPPSAASTAAYALTAGTLCFVAYEIWVLYLLVQPGDRVPNSYGDNPLVGSESYTNTDSQNQSRPFSSSNMGQKPGPVRQSVPSRKVVVILLLIGGAVLVISNMSQPPSEAEQRNREQVQMLCGNLSGHVVWDSTGNAQIVCNQP